EWRTPQPEELVCMLEGYEMRSTAADARKRYLGAGRPLSPATEAPRTARPTAVEKVETQFELF
ncbi:MAG: hypothetical protein RIQ93_3360, partial [Verrucomicrobiota bacterium]